METLLQDKYNTNSKKGLFISFEGGEGVGKSTQIDLLKSYFLKKNTNVISTREPGGTEEGEFIRKFLVSGDKHSWDPYSELLLFNALRREHINKIINPSLKNGDIVLCDRFIDASIAYQGFGKKVDLKKINMLINNFTENIKPDITIFFDLPYDLAKQRFPKNKKKDRFENLQNSFFEDVYEGYKFQLKNNKDRVKKIDANRSKNDVCEQIILALKKKFKNILL